MPADRKNALASNKPVKTERTHEENQERAYIAASRRSDRSLEARIESARRASEIHKKRTGRGLRVTEQDVINEEMYEEEDEDLPTQYQRLSAHLHTGSLMFNRKLHDYIATQHGVRNLFLQQYQPLPGYGPQVASNTGPYLQMQSPQIQNTFPGQQTMLPPQMFSASTNMYTQPGQPSSPSSFQPQQGFRQAPYTIPNRAQPHRRSASIPTSQHMHSFTERNFAPVGTPQTEEQRRSSLPAHAHEQSVYQTTENQARPSQSRTTSHTAQQQPTSPQHSPSRASLSPSTPQGSPLSQKGNSPSYSSPSSFPFMTMDFGPSSQVLNMNPLSMSMPPESQQFLGSTLDPNDPRTSIFMAGSELLPQAFPKYTYNPNIGSKISRTEETITSGSTGFNTPVMTPIKMETFIESAPSSCPPSAPSDGYISPRTYSTGYEYQSFFNDGIDYTQGIISQDESDSKAYENEFINADAW